ncbi:MAG: transcriptional repressor [Firmicutes bacterium]|nr:transcriptional repressor [Bacillota bacterium]
MTKPKLGIQLKAKGYKLTQQRQQIMNFLQDSSLRLSAQDIHQQLKQQNSAISLDTVYRNLRLLTEIGIVGQISLPSGSVYERVEDQEHHHHLVCVDCEKVVCIAYCPEMKTYMAQAGAAGFDVIGHSFEIYGRCASCRHKYLHS